MIIKYSEGKITKVVDVTDNKEDIEELVDEATEKAEKDLKKEASIQDLPFWLNQ